MQIYLLVGTAGGRKNFSSLAPGEAKRVRECIGTTAFITPESTRCSHEWL